MFMEEAQTTQQTKQKPEKELRKSRIAGFFNRFIQYRRVLEVARKPDKSEYFTSSKIIASGVALLGIIGFVLFVIYLLIIPGV